MEEITLEKTPNGLGFSISGGLFTEHIRNDHGIFVTKIIPGGSADLDGKLAVGDRLISVNGISLEYVTHDDAVAEIASVVEQYNEIVLRVGKVTQFYASTNELLTENLSPLEQDIVKLVFIFFHYFMNNCFLFVLSSSMRSTLFLSFCKENIFSS